MRTTKRDDGHDPIKPAPNSGEAVKLGLHDEIPKYDVEVEPSSATADVTYSISSPGIAPDGRQYVVCHLENFGSVPCTVRLVKINKHGEA